MAETLEFNDIFQEVKGSMNDGRLRLSRQGIIFKNSKTGKVDNIQAGELTEGIWRRVALGHGLKLLTKNGHVYKYDGFRESEFEKLSDFFKTHYRLELMEKDLCVKGWNWGTVKFGGQLLSFDIGDQPVFEIPLSNVSQCTTGKNEVTLEFHQNDDAEVSLMEVRFYVPPTQEDGVDPVEAFAQNVLSKADVIQATGDAICIFRELQCLTPRGRYDIRIWNRDVCLCVCVCMYRVSCEFSCLRLIPSKPSCPLNPVSLPRAQAGGRADGPCWSPRDWNELVMGLWTPSRRQSFHPSVRRGQKEKPAGLAAARGCLRVFIVLLTGQAAVYTLFRFLGWSDPGDAAFIQLCPKKPWFYKARINTQSPRMLDYLKSSCVRHAELKPLANPTLFLLFF